MCFAEIIKWFKKKFEVETNSMKELLSEYCDEVILLDAYYDLGDLGDLIGFLNSDATDLREYISNKFDCDDFAIMLLGLWKASMCPGNNGLGLVFVETPTGLHALNFYVTNETEVYLVEPQTDSYILLEDKTDYLPYFMMI